MDSKHHMFLLLLLVMRTLFSVIDVIWIAVTFILGSIGFLVIFLEPRLNRQLVQLYKYGKFNCQKAGAASWFEVPKRWFYHFYLFGTLLFIGILFLLIQIYFKRYRLPSRTRLYLDVLIGCQRKPSVSQESILLLTILLLTQVLRRLYECLFVSIYSNSRMNLIHYMFGLSFYFGIGLSILSEAPGIKLGSDVHFMSTNNVVTWSHLLGTYLFILASMIQFRSHKILANMRSDGNVSKYSIVPNEFLFKYVSSPHYLAEMLIYISFWIIVGLNSVTFALIMIQVEMTQVVTGIFNHEWYQQKFRDDYPKSRKAVIPFLL